MVPEYKFCSQLVNLSALDWLFAEDFGSVELRIKEP